MGDPVSQALNLGMGLFMGNQGKQAQMGGAGREQAMGQGLWQTGLAPYGKKAKAGMWDLLTPELEAVLSGKTQVINPEQTSGMYNFLTRDLNRNYNEARKGVEQGMVNRGMDYGSNMAKNLSRVDTDYRNQLADIGSKLAYNAATTNYNAQQQRYNNLLGVLGNLFGAAKAQQMGMKQQGLGMLSNANAAQTAAQGNYWNGLASMLGGTMGQFGAGQGQFNLTDWL